MLQASQDAWQEPGKYRAVEQQWVPLEKISPQLQLAVIAAEDQRFPVHFGIDTVELRRVLESTTKTRGASTITQQVAKNLFLWSGRSYFRKGLEAGIALLLELTWDKQRILEVYLNIAQFGNGVFGAEQASQLYYGKPASQLNRREAARFAAVLPNPILFKVKNPEPSVLNRQKWILQQMRNLGGVDYLDRLHDEKR